MSVSWRGDLVLTTVGRAPPCCPRSTSSVKSARRLLHRTTWAPLFLDAQFGCSRSSRTSSSRSVGARSLPSPAAWRLPERYAAPRDTAFLKPILRSRRDPRGRARLISPDLCDAVPARPAERQVNLHALSAALARGMLIPTVATSRRCDGPVPRDARRRVTARSDNLQVSTICRARGVGITPHSCSPLACGRRDDEA